MLLAVHLIFSAVFIMKCWISRLVDADAAATEEVRNHADKLIAFGISEAAHGTLTKS